MKIPLISQSDRDIMRTYPDCYLAARLQLWLSVVTMRRELQREGDKIAEWIMKQFK